MSKSKKMYGVTDDGMVADLVTGTYVKKSEPKQEEPKKQEKPISALVNDILDSEYRWCGDSLPDLLKAVLRELVTARVERGKNNG